MCVRAEYFPEYLARVIKPVFLECVQTSSPRLSVKQTSWDNNERSEFSARNVPRQKTLDKDAGDSLHALPCVYCLGFIRWPFVFGLWPLSHVALSQWKQTYSKSANSARKKLMSLMWNGKKKKDKQVQDSRCCQSKWLSNHSAGMEHQTFVTQDSILGMLCLENKKCFP